MERTEDQRAWLGRPRFRCVAAGSLWTDGGASEKWAISRPATQ